ERGRPLVWRPGCSASCSRPRWDLIGDQMKNRRNHLEQWVSDAGECRGTNHPLPRIPTTLNGNDPILSAPVAATIYSDDRPAAHTLDVSHIRSRIGHSIEHGVGLLPVAFRPLVKLGDLNHRRRRDPNSLFIRSHPLRRQYEHVILLEG